VFISYSHADRAWVERLQRMLAPLLRGSGQELRLWDDSRIEPGTKWRDAIETALAQARVAVLLVSDNFLASEFVMGQEVPKLLAAAKAEGVRVLWVSLSPSFVEETDIHHYQAVLPPSRHLEAMAEVEWKEALRTIGLAIRQALREPSPDGVPREAEPLPAPLTVAPPAPPPPKPSLAPPGLPTSSYLLQTARILWVTKNWWVGNRCELQCSPLQVEVALEELGGGVSLPLVRISAGEFVMGSPPDEPERSSDEGPQHRVRLAEFWMGQTPITQAQWRAVMASNPSFFSDQPDSAQRPVERVSWHEAMTFCQRLSERTGRTYTLPSEAQWEYACRAGTTTAFAFGATLSPQLANYKGKFTYANGPKGEDREQTTPVGLFPANAWGLQDMHGNVWEWCLDQWHGSYTGAPTDGRAWLLAEGDQSENQKLLRGGSWNYGPWFCRSAIRYLIQPVLANFDVGFRVVCLPQGPSLNP
jgi:formylglycine-generating enzyme required for sulfatase activity